uniref:Doublecortin domain-containing protein n=1 Tax=Caenorhabditis tropicalis TaxID=1561998 RepID=A0A1I7TPI3_9PELO
MSKQPKTFRSRSSDHVPVVPTMVVVNTHRVPSIDVLLDVISERIGLINGAKKLYTTSGTLIKDINKIKDGENYVASSSHFTPAAYGGQQHKEVKKKKKRSKTVHEKERRTERIELGEEITIPLNEPIEQEKKKKKKKKIVKRKVEEHHHPRHLDLAPHHGSDETLAETAEVELPSEIEDSEEEEKDDHCHHHREKTSDHRRPSTNHSISHSRIPTRSESRRGSRRDSNDHDETKEEKEKKKKDEKRRKSVSRRKSPSQQPNWGDLSSFTKNIDSLLRS